MASKTKVKRDPGKEPQKASAPSLAGSRERDETFLRRALELAREGIGLTSPNPCVGAVIPVWVR